MSIINNLDPEAFRMLGEADWVWSDTDLAFIKARDPMKEDTKQFRNKKVKQISYEDLQDHNLINPKNGLVRQAGLEWLRKSILES